MSIAKTLMCTRLFLSHLSLSRVRAPILRSSLGRFQSISTLLSAMLEGMNANNSFTTSEVLTTLANSSLNCPLTFNYMNVT